MWFEEHFKTYDFELLDMDKHVSGQCVVGDRGYTDRLS